MRYLQWIVSAWSWLSSLTPQQGREMTGAVIVAAIVLIAAWDCLAAYLWGSEATESKVIWELSQQYPIIGVAVGVLIGHLFAQMGK